MAFNLFGNENDSPDELAERRALVRALVMRQMSQRPRDMWDGLQNVVGAVGGRIAQSRLDKAEAQGQASAESNFAPLIEALRKRQTPDVDALAEVLSSPWLNPGQRSIAEGLFKQQLAAGQSNAQSKAFSKFGMDPSMTRRF